MTAVQASFETGTYPVARFGTDLPRVEEANNGGGLKCDHYTGAGCTNPPPGAFYPWFHLLPVNSLAGRHCAVAQISDIPGQISNFGGEQAAWEPLELTNHGIRPQVLQLRPRHHQPLSVTWKPVARGSASIPGPGPAVSIMAVTYG